MNTLESTVITIITALATSILTAVLLNDRLYFILNRGRLQEELILNGSVQVRSSVLTTPNDWESIKNNVEAGSVEYYIVDIKAEEDVQIKRLAKDIEIEAYKKYRCINVRNNSKMCILISEILLSNGEKRVLYDWEGVELRPNKTLTMIIDSYEEVNQLALDYNGRAVNYIISDKRGYLLCKISKKSSKELLRHLRK